VHKMCSHVDEGPRCLSYVFNVSLGSPSLSDVSATQVRELIKARRARDHHFPLGLFADPAWDILLGVFVAHLTQQRISVSGVCEHAAVPSTTALRWICTLEQGGWLIRREDPRDARRTWIELSAKAISAMQSYFHGLLAP
jgi:hypothetical protein